MEPARWRRVGELADGVEDPAPYLGAVVVLLGEQLIGARDAFLERFFTVALKHQGRGPPDVDFGYHSPRLSPIRKQSREKDVTKACSRVGFRTFAVGLPLRSSPRSGPSDGEGIVEDVPIAKQATREMSVELVDFGSARTILFSH